MSTEVVSPANSKACSFMMRSILPPLGTTGEKRERFLFDGVLKWADDYGEMFACQGATSCGWSSTSVWAVAKCQSSF